VKVANVAVVIVAALPMEPVVAENDHLVRQESVVGDHKGSERHEVKECKANGQRVRQGSERLAHHGHRANDHLVRQESVVDDHKGSERHEVKECKANGQRVRQGSERLAHHGHRANDRLVRQGSERLNRQLKRHRQPQRLQRLWSQRLHRSPNRQPRPLRASRGDFESCYWHRHEQSTAGNTAVA
jgi:hypothetical protein